MTVLTIQDQLRQTRIDSLTSQVRDLLSGRSNPTSISLEDLASKIKHHSGVLVELRDEQISKLVVLLNELFNTYVKDETSRGGEAARVAIKTTEKNFDFVDKTSYLDDPEEITRLRQPVVRSYFSCFRRSKSAKNPSVEDFFKCLDMQELREDLDRSEFILQLPMFFTMKDNVLQFDRLNDLLTIMSDSLTTQNEKICSLLEGALQCLSRSELIPNADRIDLQSSKFTSMGVTIEPTIVNKINQMWYQNNLTTKIEYMVDDLTQVLREPYRVIARQEEGPKGGFKRAMNLMASDGFSEQVRLAQMTAKGLTDKVQIISDQLVRFSQRIQTIPSRETEGYYNTAVEDIARFLSVYSGVLAVVLEFVLDYVEGLKAGVDGIEVLSTNLRTHQITAAKYVAVRKDMKWQ